MMKIIDPAGSHGARLLGRKRKGGCGVIRPFARDEILTPERPHEWMRKECIQARNRRLLAEKGKAFVRVHFWHGCGQVVVLSGFLISGRRRKFLMDMAVLVFAELSMAHDKVDD